MCVMAGKESDELRCDGYPSKSREFVDESLAIHPVAMPKCGN